MIRLAIAMDLGTSGFRAQALDLFSGDVLSTIITRAHPLPGANVIDQIHFALEFGVQAARDIMIHAVNQVIEELRVTSGHVVRLAVCGNPAQLSLFQGMEIRDLAFAGSRKLKALGVIIPQRGAMIRLAAEFPGLALPAKSSVIIPPAVRHEIGADALALIIQTGILNRDETAIAIDYGTNAEMALVHKGRVYTGSAAAGPALEGQQIACGMLGMPGAISDLEFAGTGHRLIILNSEMQPIRGALINLRNATDVTNIMTPRALGLTGTGAIAALDQALEAGIIVLPRIHTADRRLNFGKNIFFTEADLAEAGKALGALRAGYFALSMEAGIAPGDIRTAYLAGASGTYVDGLKGMRLGMIPPCVKTIRQVGNTSLAMARDLAVSPMKLEAMDDLARKLQETHCVFGLSKTFANVFLLELSYWTEGMPMSKYRELLRRYRFPDLPLTVDKPQIIRTARNEIGDLGRMGMAVLENTGMAVELMVSDCTGCAACVRACPGRALSINTEAGLPKVCMQLALCNGVACRRCETACPLRVFQLNAFLNAALRNKPKVENELLRK